MKNNNKWEILTDEEWEVKRRKLMRKMEELGWFASQNRQESQFCCHGNKVVFGPFDGSYQITAGGFQRFVLRIDDVTQYKSDQILRNNSMYNYFYEILSKGENWVDLLFGNIVFSSD